MTEEERIRQVAREAAHDAATEATISTLKALGIDPAESKEMYADMLFLRRQRVGAEQFGKHAKLVLIGVVVTGGLYALWQGVVQAIISGRAP